MNFKNRFLFINNKINVKKSLIHKIILDSNNIDQCIDYD